MRFFFFFEVWSRFVDLFDVDFFPKFMCIGKRWRNERCDYIFIYILYLIIISNRGLRLRKRDCGIGIINVRKLWILVLKYDSLSMKKWKEGRKNKIKRNTSIDCNYCFNTDLGMNVIFEKILHYIASFYINNHEYINSFVSKEYIFASGLTSLNKISVNFVFISQRVFISQILGCDVKALITPFSCNINISLSNGRISLQFLVRH